MYSTTDGMEQYDVAIIGGSTTGAFFARRMAERGMKVLVLEKEPREKVGTIYDIFHMSREDLKRYSLPVPQPGDADYVFSFEDSCNYSAFGHYPKPSAKNPVVGMHKHIYILRLLDWAQEAGAVIRFETPFEDFLLENDRIAGVKFTGGEVHAEIVADCSGIPAVGRTKLPASANVENFVLSPEDMFFVILWYVHYKEKHEPVNYCHSWPYWKSWEAPQQDPDGAIVGTGACFSFDYCEKMHREFRKHVKLPEYEVEKVEKGRTPYHRPLYSFVTDHFIVMGDAACLTNPSTGEGCASSMAQAEIAADVIGSLAKEGKPLTCENLWPVNKRYQEAQGKAFASLLATLVNVTKSSPEENEFMFRKDIVFSRKLFANMEAGLNLTKEETRYMIWTLIGGLLSGKMSFRTIRSLQKASSDAEAVEKLYDTYPSSPDGFGEWCVRADSLWKKVGTIAEGEEKKS